MVRRSSIPILLLLAAAGCRSSAVQEFHQSVLERENRTLEDHIYYLEDVIAGFEMRLESAQRENDALKRELGRDGDEAGTAPRAPVGTPAPGDEAPPGQRPPKVELGTETLPEPTQPDNAPDTTPQKHDKPRSHPAEVPPNDHGRARSGEVNPPVARIVLNRWLTGGMDADGHDGHEGVLAVIEPRDARGRLVKAAGELAVAVIDPAESGPAARVAAWHFTADEAAARFRTTAPGRGIHLELPWPNELPKRDRLRLRVRYVRPDGQVLEAEHPFRIRLPEPLPGRLAQAARHSRQPADLDLAPAPVQEAKEPARLVVPAAARPLPTATAELPPQPQPRRPAWQPTRG